MVVVLQCLRLECVSVSVFPFIFVRSRFQNDNSVRIDLKPCPIFSVYVIWASIIDSSVTANSSCSYILNEGKTSLHRRKQTLKFVSPNYMVGTKKIYSLGLA